MDIKKIPNNELFNRIMNHPRIHEKMKTDLIESCSFLEDLVIRILELTDVVCDITASKYKLSDNCTVTQVDLSATLEYLKSTYWFSNSFQQFVEPMDDIEDLMSIELSFTESESSAYIDMLYMIKTMEDESSHQILINISKDECVSIDEPTEEEIIDEQSNVVE